MDGSRVILVLLQEHRSREFELFESGNRFVSCDDEALPRGWYAGTKMLECEFCPGAFNQLDLSQLVAAIRRVEWDSPASVQLFIQEQEEEKLKEADLNLLPAE